MKTQKDNFTGSLNGESYPIRRVNSLFKLPGIPTKEIIYVFDKDFSFCYGDINIFKNSISLVLTPFYYDYDLKEIIKYGSLNSAALFEKIELTGLLINGFICSRKLTINECIAFDGYRLKNGADLINITENKGQQLSLDGVQLYKNSGDYQIYDVVDMRFISIEWVSNSRFIFKESLVDLRGYSLYLGLNPVSDFLAWTDFVANSEFVNFPPAGGALL